MVNTRRLFIINTRRNCALCIRSIITWGLSMYRSVSAWLLSQWHRNPMIRARQEDSKEWTPVTLFALKINTTVVVLWFGGKTYEGKTIVASLLSSSSQCVSTCAFIIDMDMPDICIDMHVAHFQVWIMQLPINHTRWRMVCYWTVIELPSSSRPLVQILVLRMKQEAETLVCAHNECCYDAWMHYIWHGYCFRFF